MAISPKLLGTGEEVVIDTRTHVKVLFVPALLLILFAALTGFLLTLPSGNGTAATVVRWAIVIVAVVVTVWFVLLPFLQWLAATYTLTNRRLITRGGIITRRGRDIPLARISDVNFEKSVLDRILGCGTLIVSDATEQSGVVLTDIPDVEAFHLTLNEMLFPTAPGHQAGPRAAGAEDEGAQGDVEHTRRFDDGT
jgi:uncharacterized membrane protein YdbT with pleckstrin-like domain